MCKCQDMPYHAGLVLRIYPSNRQKRMIAFNDGNQRFVYNRLTALERERWQLSKLMDIVPAYKERVDYIDSILRNPDKGLAQCIKNSAPFLYSEDADSLAVDNAIKNHNKAWNNYKNSPGFGTPTFHKKGYEQSYNTNAHYHTGAQGMNDSNVRFENHKHIILPILGRIRISGSYKQISEIMDRDDTRISSIRIYKNPDDSYYISLQLASEKPFFYCDDIEGDSPVGIDLNIDNFLYDSDGNEVQNPKFRRSRQDELAKKAAYCFTPCGPGEKRKTPS